MCISRICVVNVRVKQMFKVYIHTALYLMGVYMLQHVQREGVSGDITHTRGFPALAPAGAGLHLRVSYSTRGVQVSTHTINMH